MRRARLIVRLLAAAVLASGTGCRRFDAGARRRDSEKRRAGESVIAETGLGARQVPVEVRILTMKGAVFTGPLLAYTGKVYVPLCRHNSPARLLEYDPAADEIKCVATMTSGALRGGPNGAALGPDEKPVLLDDDARDQRPGNMWKHAQGKIHVKLCEGPDGKIYGATHTGTEIPDHTREYPGGHFFSYDAATGLVKDLGWARRHEGIIAMCMDKKRMLLYGITWPSGFLVSCRLDRDEDYVPGKGVRIRILGLTSGQLGYAPRYFDVLKDGRVFMCDAANGDVLVWIPDDYGGPIEPEGVTKLGRLCRATGMTTPFDADERAPRQLRESKCFGNWWMTGVCSPDGEHIFTSPQRRGRLVEIDGTYGTFGRIIDHPCAVPWPREADSWIGPVATILGFGPNGMLYYHATDGKDRHLLTYDSGTGEMRDWGIMSFREKADDESGAERPAHGVDGRMYGMFKLPVAGSEDEPVLTEDDYENVRHRYALGWFHPADLKESRLLHKERRR